jgi:predicted  nucleic acid-binding Zn-ribbon protein
MRIAVVVTEDTPGPLADGRARLEQARSRGEALLVAPPQVSAALGETGHWAEPAACDRATVGVRPGPAPLAFEALRSLGPLDEARFEAASAAGQVACAEARTGGVRVAARLVVELGTGDGALAREVVLGDRIEDRLHLCAARMALRDADVVEGGEGPGGAREALLGAGWTLAAPQPEPAWPAAEQPGVSAVITFYNLGRYLPACLASLRAQTAPCEVIVVDDGSRPEDAAVLDAEAAKDPALRVIRQANQGVVAARHAGIRAASHPLVLVVDADNVLRPRLVERLREALRLRPDAAWANPAFRSFGDATGETAFVYGCVEHPGELLLLRNVVGDVCALYRRTPLEQLGFRAPHPHFIEDWDLWLRAMEAGLAGVAVPELLFDYRERPDSNLHAPDATQRRLSSLRMLQGHPALVAAHAEPVFRLLACELVADVDYNQSLGRQQREPEVAELRGRAAAFEAEAGSQGARASTLEAEVRSLRAGASALGSEVQSLRAGVAALEAEVQSEGARAATLGAALGAQRAQAEALGAELGEARAREARLDGELVAHRQRLAALEAEAAKLEGALRDASWAQRALEEREQGALGRAAAAEQELRDLRSAAKDLQGALDEVMSSRAVKAAQALRAVSPALHRRGAQLAGLLANLLNARNR